MMRNLTLGVKKSHPYLAMLLIIRVFLCSEAVSVLILQLNKTEIGNEIESDIESCKQACLSNCSCKAAVFWSSVENGETCYLLPEIFSLMKDAYLPDWTTFIKVQNISNPEAPRSSSNPKVPQSSSNPEVPQSCNIVMKIIYRWVIGAKICAPIAHIILFMQYKKLKNPT